MHQTDYPSSLALCNSSQPGTSQLGEAETKVAARYVVIRAQKNEPITGCQKPGGWQNMEKMVAFGLAQTVCNVDANIHCLPHRWNTTTKLTGTHTTDSIREEGKECVNKKQY